MGRVRGLLSRASFPGEEVGTTPRRSPRRALDPKLCLALVASRTGGRTTLCFRLAVTVALVVRQQGSLACLLLVSEDRPTALLGLLLRFKGGLDQSARVGRPPGRGLKLEQGRDCRWTRGDQASTLLTRTGDKRLTARGHGRVRPGQGTAGRSARRTTSTGAGFGLPQVALAGAVQGWSR